MDTVYKGFLGICVISAFIVIIELIMGYRAEVGPLVTVFFISFAIGVRRIPALRSFAFTIWVVAAISTAMFYPSWFR
ncbi:hypothetical protein ACFL2X_07240 [Candidatus Latescibacterota bacterium]